MAKTIIVCGYGPGISQAVAERFGAAGFGVALVARNSERLAAGVKALEGKGVKAAAFPADLSDPEATRAVVGKVRDALGPVTVIEWTAYGGSAGDLLTAETPAIRKELDSAVTCLLAAVQAALPDLKTQKDAAVLVLNGGLGYSDPQVDAAGVQFNAMGLAVANAAKHKLVGLLSQKMKGDGIYVGEAMVMGSVKTGATDNRNAAIEPKTIASKLWDLYQARKDVTVQIS